jgi:preprotein translocase subunit SecF
MRLRLVRENTSFDFFRFWRVTFGASALAVVASIVIFAMQGLNFGIDFRGGTTIRTDGAAEIDIAAWRAAIAPLGLGDVSITEVFDPGFEAGRHVAMVRVQAQEGAEATSPELIAAIEAALRTIDPTLTFPAVESVGPKVSGELVTSALMAVGLSLLGVMAYIWVRFEWQFAVGAVAALIHDVVLTIGIFSLFQIRFDLAIIAALLTIIGYSINDTVVVFDRVRENLIRFKQRALTEVLNLSINDTMSRTLMTSGTTLLALVILLVLGGDVIRGFVFAMTWGIVVGTYSSVFVASQILVFLGVKRDWTKGGTAEGPSGTRFAGKDGTGA